MDVTCFLVYHNVYVLKNYDKVEITQKDVLGINYAQW